MIPSRSLFAAFSAGFAVMGIDKIIGDRRYSRMYCHLGWSAPESA